MIDELLTVRALQDLLHVDRTTIYRMLQENRLPGFKVGGQWRFSRQEIDGWLAEQQLPRAEGAAEKAPGLSQAAQVLPLHCLQPIQNVFAEAMDVGSVTTSPDGAPFTTMSSPAGFCKLVTASAEGLRRCESSWRALGRQAAASPKIARCHAGLCYARGQVRVEGECVALVFAGQFLPVGETADRPRVQALAAECGIDESELQRAAASLRAASPEQAGKTLRLLQVVADTFSSIGEERRSLLGRLKRISEMSAV